jgi:Zn-dependent metalloprotease
MKPGALIALRSAVVFFFLISASSSFSQGVNPKIISGLSNLNAKKEITVDVKWYDDKKRVKTLYGKLSDPYPGTAEEAATQFLKENPDIFQLPQDLSGIKIERVREIGRINHREKLVIFQQAFGSLPVFDGGLDVYLKEDNSIELVHNYYVPNIAVDPHPSLSEEQIIERAKTDFSENCRQRIDKKGTLKSCEGQPLNIKKTPMTQLGIFEQNRQPHLAYQLIMDIESPRALMQYTIDAHTGQILKKRDLIQN